MLLNGVNHVALLTHDTDWLVAFYREVFDAEIGAHLEEFDGAIQLTFIRIGPTAELADRIWTGMGVLEAIDDASCLLHVGADSPWALSWMITSIDTNFTVTDPPELVEQIEILARRCAAAIRA